jgi:hypothetical protein
MRADVSSKKQAPAEAEPARLAARLLGGLLQSAADRQVRAAAARLFRLRRGLLSGNLRN